MKHAWLIAGFLFAACSADNRDNNTHADSVPEDAAAAPVVEQGPEQTGEEGLEDNGGNSEEMVDSIGYYNAAVYAWINNEGERTVELRYTVRGERKKFLLTDSVPEYLNPVYSHEVVQANGTGDEEIILRITNWRVHGGAGVTTSTGEQRNLYFVFEPGTNGMLFSGSDVFQIQNICGSGSGADCEDFETGYSYKIHFARGAIVLDSLEYFGDGGNSEPDRRMGKYRWQDGVFINPD